MFVLRAQMGNPSHQQEIPLVVALLEIFKPHMYTTLLLGWDHAVGPFTYIAIGCRCIILWMH